MRELLLLVLILGSLTNGLGASGLRVATFRSDVTPDAGEPLIWVTPVAKVEDPLWAKGVILDDGRARYVLCAVDWCGLGGSTHLLFRTRIAEAAGTPVERVAVQAVHQHTAPYIDGDGYTLLRGLKNPPLLMSDAFLRRVTELLAQSVREAAARLEPFDRIGVGQASVERVASARRLVENGRVITRYSTGGSNPAMAALPEGPIDPALRTITLAAGEKPLVRLHFYATHPQTFCCDGRVSGDIAGAAREAIEKEDGIFQVYFTGCAGDVTVGKYNNGSVEARAALTRRLEQGMRASIESTRYQPAQVLKWQNRSFFLPLKTAPQSSAATMRSILEHPGEKSGQDLYRTAISLAFALRKRPLQASSLDLGAALILLLPGEPMLEFQRYAQALHPGTAVATAGYGDISPGYLCTDQAFLEGGYEPSASNAGPGTETRVKNVIRKLLH